MIKDKGSKEALNININEIFKILPHRYPFLMIDKVIELVPNNKIIALKNITINEQLFIGHFPEEPVFPGVMTAEAMAQACAILSFITDNTNFIKEDNKLDLKDHQKPQLPYLVKIDAQFNLPVRPGDSLIIQSCIASKRLKFSLFECICKVDSKVVASAKIMATKQ